jgi:NADPH2:quinone reductase
MKALQFLDPAPDASRSVVAAVPVPTPQAGEVAIDVAWAGINFKDVMQRRGDHGYVLEWPFVPGLEVSGTVSAVGPGVAERMLGRQVTALTGAGGLAEVAVADSRLVREVPDGLSLRDAAAAPGALVSAALLIDTFGHLRPGEAVLVHSAAGAVGAAVAQLARHRGAGLVVGVVGSTERVDAARKHGYDEVFVRGRADVEHVRDVLARPGVDLVLDPLGTIMLGFDVDITAPGGRVIIFGNASGALLAEPPSVPTLMGKGLQLGGFSLAALKATVPQLVAETLNEVLVLIRDGVLRPEIVTVPGLAGVPAVHDALTAGAGRGKYLVSMA